MAGEAVGPIRLLSLNLMQVQRGLETSILLRLLVIFKV